MHLEVNSTDKLPPLLHPWDQCITIGRAYELLREDLQSHLRFLQKEFGYKHIRFHASFHDDIAVVEKQSNGEIVYRWTQLDHIYDFLVDAGFDPIVEINPMPKALASGEKTMFWYKKNITPPADYAEWEEFLKAYLAHTIERYGITRVKKWRFEIWNEPDLRDTFWTGTQEEYFQLYATCAKVLKAFSPDLLVGGPATAGTEWILELAQFCKTNQVPLDFISYHNYPQNEACRYLDADASPSQRGMYFIDLAKKTKADLAENGFGHLPIYMTEWNSQSHDSDWKAKWYGNETVNNLFAGAAVCHLAHGCDESFNILGWWVASDVFEEGGPQVEPYGNRYQYYGMLTIDGVPKSSYHAFSFLNKMRGQRYALKLPKETKPTQNGIVTDELASTRALFWNTCFPDDNSRCWDFQITVPVAAIHLNRDKIRVSRAHVKAEQGSAYEYWKTIGAPPNLTKIEQTILAAKALPEYSASMQTIQNGQVTLHISLNPNEFIFLEIGGDPEGNITHISSEQESLNQALMV